MPDEVTVGWVLEFVLRQPIEDWLVNEIFLALPISPNLSSRLVKTLLLRRLASELSRRSVSERTLHSLELLHELSLSHGAPDTTELLCSAYCAVAIECAAGFLRFQSSDDHGGFFDAVNRVWSQRVRDLEKSYAAGLVSDSLRAARGKMEEALVNPRVRDAVKRRDTKKDALDALTVYLKREIKKMGPSFLELVVEAITGDGADGMYPSLMELKDKLRNSGMGKENEYLGKGDVLGDKIHLLATPEVNKVKEDLRMSCLGLQEKVRDPLPDAIALAAGISNKTSGGMVNSKEDGNTTECCVQKDIVVGAMQNEEEEMSLRSCPLERSRCQAKDIQAEGAIADLNGSTSHVHQAAKACGSRTDGVVPVHTKDNEGQKHSIMDRNPTAHTYEWGDDSIEASSNEAHELLKKPSLPSLKRRAVSPLKVQDGTRIARRRKPRMWTTLEEDTLREAVKKYGKGNWKVIKSSYPDIFEGRTEVDLKDKWRNMTK